MMFKQQMHIIRQQKVMMTKNTQRENNEERKYLKNP